MKLIDAVLMSAITAYGGFMGGSYVTLHQERKAQRSNEVMGYAYGMLTTAYDYGLAPNEYICQVVNSIHASQDKTFVPMDEISGYNDLNNLCGGTIENGTDNGVVKSPRAGGWTGEGWDEGAQSGQIYTKPRSGTSSACTETSDNCT